MPFKKGQSGNPAGRPKGIKDRRRKFLEMDENEVGTILRNAIDMAMEGDVQMVKYVLDRLWPVKPSDAFLEVELDLSGNSHEQANQVMEALGEGYITPLEAQRVMASIKQYSETVEVAEFIRMLDEIDKVLKEKHDVSIKR